MPRERQRRTLDAPSQQAVTEVVVKTPQPIHVDRVLINPDHLDDALLPDGALAREEGVVEQGEPVV